MTQNIPNTPQEKSTFFKVGMVIVSYYAPVLIFGFILEAIFASIFLSTSTLPGVTAPINPLITIVLPIITFFIALCGLYLGVRYVSKKAIISSKDIVKVITWFVVIQALVLLVTISKSSFTLIIINIAELVINCLAIKYFFGKRSTTI